MPHMPVHELLHAICYCEGQTLYIGISLKKIAAFAVCHEKKQQVQVRCDESDACTFGNYTTCGVYDCAIVTDSYCNMYTCRHYGNVKSYAGLYECPHGI